MEKKLAQFIEGLESEIFAHRKDIHNMAKKLSEAKDASDWMIWSGEDLVRASERILAKEDLINGLKLVQSGAFTIEEVEEELNKTVMRACGGREHTHMDSLIGNAKRHALIRLQEEFKGRL